MGTHYNYTSLIFVITTMAKTITKGVSKEGTGTTKRSKKRVESYTTYINKVLKECHDDLNISKHAILIMNSFVTDTFEEIAMEASTICRYTKKDTLGLKEISTAVKLVLPGELAKHAIAEGTKSLNKYKGL